MGRLQVLLDPPVVMDLCRDRNGHGVSVLAAGKLPRPAVERRQSLASGVGLQPGTWRYYLPASRRERPLHCSQAAGLYGLAVQSHAKGKWQHTSPESRHLSSSTLPTHRLKPKHTPKRTTPSRKTGALLVHATTGPVSNRLRSPAKEHITEQRLNACGSHRTPARFCCQELSAIHADTLLHQWHLRQSLSTPRREHTLLVYFRGFAS